jgi:uncharacterized membrane protein YccF (DUF307 family)
MLLDCPECQSQVSSEAKSCPECGFPVAKIKAKCKDIHVAGAAKLVQSPTEIKKFTAMPVSEHGGCMRAIYFVFIGYWLGAVVEMIGQFLLHTIIFLPIGSFILERVPCFLTLRNYRWRAAKKQIHLGIRILYFVCFGWWIGHIVSVFAHFLKSIIIGLPLAQNLMERRAAFYSLKQYVPRNMAEEAEPEAAPSPVWSFMVGGSLLTVITVVILVYYSIVGTSTGSISEQLIQDLEASFSMFKAWLRRMLSD